MSTYPNTTELYWNQPTVVALPNYQATSNFDIKVDKDQVIRIDDFSDVETTSESKPLYTTIATNGALLSAKSTLKLNKETFVSIAGSAILSAFLSTWIQAETFLSLFLGLSLINIITSIIFDQSLSFKNKITSFGMDLFYVGIVMGLADILLNLIKIPFIDSEGFYVGTMAFLFSINYILLISKRLYPLTTLSGSKTVMNLAKVFKEGVDKFKELQEEDSIN